MNKATKLVAAVGVVGVMAAAGAGYASTNKAVAEAGAYIKPAHGVSLDLGGKHAVGYFEAKGETCHLTVVLADVNGGETGDTPGTRIVVPVLPGKTLQVDGGSGKSAVFACGPGASRMSARVFDRAPYAKS